MKNKLMELPATIKGQRMILLERTAKIEELTASLKKWEAAEMADITNETDCNGKPVFSNAEKRASELARRKEALPWVVELESDISALRYSFELVRIDMQYNIDMQENYRAIARLGGGEV
ncbi:MAG: hypothetical protein PHV93_04905 [Candidatus Pacebacteria bacterium]|jgi:hypothetical protein|nr:hypothetical protein [Candidatus Paceibacterota bacterium]